MLQDKIKSKKVFVGAKEFSIYWSPKVRTAFLLHLAVRVLMETIFLFLLYLIQTYQTKQTGVSVDI